MIVKDGGHKSNDQGLETLTETSERVVDKSMLKLKDTAVIRDVNDVCLELTLS